jgi:hypothetical protein
MKEEKEREKGGNGKKVEEVSTEYTRPSNDSKL